MIYLTENDQKSTTTNMFKDKTSFYEMRIKSLVDVGVLQKVL